MLESVLHPLNSATVLHALSSLQTCLPAFQSKLAVSCQDPAEAEVPQGMSTMLEDAVRDDADWKRLSMIPDLLKAWPDTLSKTCNIVGDFQACPRPLAGIVCMQCRPPAAICSLHAHRCAIIS